MGMAKGGDVFPRKTGQIEGPGTKTSDSIPAMLSDGEFVQRTDAVNGAGVMMGATNAQQAREKGADFMYALQDKLAKMGQKSSVMAEQTTTQISREAPFLEDYRATFRRRIEVYKEGDTFPKLADQPISIHLSFQRGIARFCTNRSSSFYSSSKTNGH